MKYHLRLKKAISYTGAFCGPTVWDSFPRSKISEEANTCAASHDTSAAPFTKILFADSGFCFFAFLMISAASSPVTIP